MASFVVGGARALYGDARTHAGTSLPDPFRDR